MSYSATRTADIANIGLVPETILRYWLANPAKNPYTSWDIMQELDIECECPDEAVYTTGSSSHRGTGIRHTRCDICDREDEVWDD